MSKTNPNFLGEQLRDEAFVKLREDDYGCYSTFLVHRDYKRIDGSTPDGYDLIHSAAVLMDCSYDDIKDNTYLNFETATLMCYYWDGDGVLMFTTPKYSVMNTDCKKSDRWKYL